MIKSLESEDTAMKLDDYYLCGYLAIRGFMPVGVQSSGYRKHFVYPKDKQLQIEEMVQSFYSDKVEVNLPMLRMHIKDLKGLMTNGG